MRHKKIVDKTTQGTRLIQPYSAMIVVEALSIFLWVVATQTPYKNALALAVSASTILLTYFVWKSSQQRRDFGRGHAIGTSLAIGAYIIASILIGPFEVPMLLLWVIGGLTLAISWNIRTFIRAENRTDPLTSFFEEHRLPQTKWKVTKKGDDISEGTVATKPGIPVEEIMRIKGNLASLFQVPSNGVRITPDPNNSSKGFWKLVRRDMLKDVVTYTFDPTPQKVDDPITIGWYEDGSPETFRLHSPKLGAVHLLIQGMNGSGKSEAAKIMFAETFKKPETEMWVIDVTKGEQTLGTVRDYLDWVITEEKIADLLFKRFPKVIKARADHLGKKKLPKWQEGCGLSFIYMHIEEASGLIAQNPAFIKMMETARSVGIQITASLQRASHVAIDTAARAQFSAVICFGVQDIADADFALPDEVLDMGANPAVWKNRNPGYNYLVHPDIEQEYYVTPARTKIISDDVLVQAGEKRLPHELDPVTLAALGDLYQAQLDTDAEENSIDDLNAEGEEMPEDNFDALTPAEIEKLEELESQYNTLLEFDKAPKLPAGDAQKVLEDRLAELREQGNEFKAPDLKDVLLETGLSRAWLYKQLQTKVDAGELEKEDHVYRFPPKLKKKQ